MSDTGSAHEHAGENAACENPLCPGGGTKTFVCDRCGHRFCEKCYLRSSEVGKFLCPRGHRAVDLLKPMPLESAEPKQQEQPATIYWP